MPILRLTQHQESDKDYRVEIAFEDDDRSRLTTDVRFPFELTRMERADLRWYMEDYLQYPLDPAPEIAKRIENWIAELGKSLFHSVFEVNDDAREMLPSLRTKLDDMRVEVFTDVPGATAIPWELLRDPRTDASMALRAKAFVRSFSKPVQKAYIPKSEEKIRILLVICRPSGGNDVPFRSVANKLLKGLTDEAREVFELDVLRPPTFEQLSKTLREAKAKGQPYHIVHFDGHGMYAKVQGNGGGFNLSHLLYSAQREGSHGYLLFENPREDENIELIDGPRLGGLLVETDVPVLVLNACRSAHAEIQEQPKAEEEAADVHSQVSAFGSLAQEVMDAGVAGVVAMRYNVYVVTAAQFVADLYAALAQGGSLGEAVSMGRKQLAAQPLREIAFDPLPLQDWSVPVVYEAAPIQLLPRVGAQHVAPIKIDLSKDYKAKDDLPRPDVGFYGRDETLLALDRAFDPSPSSGQANGVVLLHAFAGSGKTMTAAEFARWYSQTGGLDGPILFTSFEQYKPLNRVLDSFEQVFKPLLEQNNIQWLALSDEDRLNVAIQVLKQIPVLWIWDNVEPINGFPAGTDSAWSLAEQRELKTFLQIVTGQSKTKFLLTSRRDEQAWLGDVPVRVSLPPMPMQERVQLARALADKQRKKITDVQDWMPLLRFTQGNPLTITVIVGQALRDGISTKTQIKEYLRKLNNGEQAFQDEQSEGRAKSLGASLSYGFEQAFTEDERKVLALLHFFQGFVNVQVLRIMLNPTSGEWGLGNKNFTDQTGIALLDKASDIGLLTSLDDGYYTIHPALPWFFKSLFEQYYPQTVDSGPLTESLSSVHRPSSALAATRAFVESMGNLGDYYAEQYEHGNRDVIAPLRLEEPNLLQARSLAHQHEWWYQVISTMQGLRQLYDHTGRRLEWKRLVNEIVPDFVDKDGNPIHGREEEWLFVSQWMRLLFMEQRDYLAAENQTRKEVEFNRRRAASLLTRPMESLSGEEKNILRTMAVSIGQLGNILMEQGKSEIVEASLEAISLYQKIGDKASEAVRSFNLGHAYKALPALRNLDEAERWYQRSLEIRAEGDRKGRAITIGQLGYLANERYDDAKKAGKPQEELSRHINTAVDYYQQALALLPPDAVDDLAVVHNQLGLIYDNAGDLERALEHYNQAIKLCEMAGNYFNAGLTQENVAIAIAPHGRIDDALLYANAAIKNFSHYGDGAAQAIQKVQQTISWIEQMRKR